MILRNTGVILRRQGSGAACYPGCKQDDREVVVQTQPPHLEVVKRYQALLAGALSAYKVQ